MRVWILITLPHECTSSFNFLGHINAREPIPNATLIKKIKKSTLIETHSHCDLISSILKVFPKVTASPSFCYRKRLREDLGTNKNKYLLFLGEEKKEQL
jgi:hypothetical protein